MHASALLHLLQLSSPSLPIGAYSYSQGLEAAIENGRVSSEAAARAWIGHALHEVVARFEAPIFARLVAALRPAMQKRSRVDRALHRGAIPRSFAPRPSRWAIRWASWSPT
jgi:urease accessory protein UreF